jgi:hypothetical protein
MVSIYLSCWCIIQNGGKNYNPNRNEKRMNNIPPIAKKNAWTIYHDAEFQMFSLYCGTEPYKNDTIHILNTHECISPTINT